MTTTSNRAVRTYWDAHIHDLGVSSHTPGSPGFFADLDAYHFEKLHHLLRLVDFDAWRGRDVLDVGCGAGVEVIRFARGGARVTGVDLSSRAVSLTSQNLTQQGLRAGLAVADGERLPFRDESMDFVYAHGVMQYTTDGRGLAAECRRVLRPGGQALFQVYNRVSWLTLLSAVSRVGLEHEDAPVLRKYSAQEFKTDLQGFRKVDLIYERFPVKSRLHKGLKAAVFNAVFVGTFNALPRAWVRRYGWHLLALCQK